MMYYFEIDYLGLLLNPVTIPAATTLTNLLMEPELPLYKQNLVLFHRLILNLKLLLLQVNGFSRILQLLKPLPLLPPARGFNLLKYLKLLLLPVNGFNQIPQRKKLQLPARGFSQVPKILKLLPSANGHNQIRQYLKFLPPFRQLLNSGIQLVQLQ
jgi:hypothetical protein